MNCGIPIKVIVLEDDKITEIKCNLMKIETVLENAICLNNYLDGIEAYISCFYNNIHFIKKLKDLNGHYSYVYDSDKNRLFSESNANINKNICDYVQDGKINLISIPIIYDRELYEFEKAYDVLEDFNEALSKIDYDSINILPLDPDEYLFEDDITYDDAIIGDYTFTDFCEQFGHCYDAQTHTFKENFSVISDNVEKILPYTRNVSFAEKFSFNQNDKTFIKNVFLSRLKITIPFLVNGIILKNAIINIKNSNFVPNISRNNLNPDYQKILSYAIGKALHLWILDHVSLSIEESTLLKKFIDVCYHDNNLCLKQTK